MLPPRAWRVSWAHSLAMTGPHYRWLWEGEGKKNGSSDGASYISGVIASTSYSLRNRRLDLPRFVCEVGWWGRSREGGLRGAP